MRDWPLALCDPGSVSEKDIVPGDLVYSGFVMENCQIHYHPDQKWYYLSDQTADEAIVFIQGDSSGTIAHGKVTPWIYNHKCVANL